MNITQDNLTNQPGVVKNEVKVNVLNAPYGGFPWLDLPQIANMNWYNAHNFYGDLAHLDAATPGDVKQFFTTYYSPNNAVLVVTGDIDPAQTLALVKKYFAAIPASTLPPFPDISEPRQEAVRPSGHATSSSLDERGGRQAAKWKGRALRAARLPPPPNDDWSRHVIAPTE